MKDWTSMVVGAEKGIGYYLSLELAKAGSTVVMVCQDTPQAKEARIRLIAESKNPNVDLLTGNLSLLLDIRKITRHFHTYYSQLNVLAFASHHFFPMANATTEGNNPNWSANVLAPHLITNELLPLLNQADYSHILTVSGDDHHSSKRYSPGIPQRLFPLPHIIRRQVNFQRIAWTYELAHRLRYSNINAHTFCPGTAYTGIFQHYPPFLQKTMQWLSGFSTPSTQKTAKAMVSILKDPRYNLQTGCYFQNGIKSQSAPVTYERKYGIRIWQQCRKETGTKPSTLTPNPSIR
jgi:NAD(P)-dependent dehydrogenase (short-subunit alcohol dehydrogenase family)